MKPEQMQPDKRYRFVHKLESQRYRRVSCLIFLGIGGLSRMNPDYQFSGRDSQRGKNVCGTVTFRKSNIIEVREMPDDAKLYINERA